MINIKDVLKETKTELIAIIIATIVLAIATISLKIADKYEKQIETTTVEMTEQIIESTTESTTGTTVQTTESTTEERTIIITTATEQTYVTTYDTIAEKQIDSATINRIAGICYGEAKGSTPTEIAKVVWCICNRADAWNQTLWQVATAPNQFYFVDNLSYRDIAIDVLDRWLAEKQGVQVNRELGKDYLWFTGDGRVNHYRTHF